MFIRKPAHLNCMIISGYTKKLCTGARFRSTRTGKFSLPYEHFIWRAFTPRGLFHRLSLFTAIAIY